MKQVEILPKAWGQGGEHILKYVAKKQSAKIKQELIYD